MLTVHHEKYTAGWTAGGHIALTLTTAMCWGLLSIAMKQVLPPWSLTPWFGIGLLLLPPLRLFSAGGRWLILLAVATAGFLGNFSFLARRCNI